MPGRVLFGVLLYPAPAGVSWPDLPAAFGRWDAPHNRFRRWVHSGGLRRLFEARTADPRFGSARRAPVDSTTGRAHRRGRGTAEEEAVGAARTAAPPRASAAAAAG